MIFPLKFSENDGIFQKLVLYFIESIRDGEVFSVSEAL